MNRIREVASEKKIKVEQIIRSTGIAKSSMYQIINDEFEPSVSKALKIAKVLDSTVEELFI
jgi:putative transcriptional regulator